MRYTWVFKKYDSGGGMMEIFAPDGPSIFHTEITQEGIEGLIACLQMNNLSMFQFDVVVDDE